MVNVLTVCTLRLFDKHLFYCVLLGEKRKMKSTWCEEEDERLFMAKTIFSSPWNELVTIFPGRSCRSLKSRWNGHVSSGNYSHLSKLSASQCVARDPALGWIVNHNPCQCDEGDDDKGDGGANNGADAGGDDMGDGYVTIHTPLLENGLFTIQEDLRDTALLEETMSHPVAPPKPSNAPGLEWREDRTWRHLRLFPTWSMVEHCS